MPLSSIILVERIRHAPLAGSLSGVAVRREPGGGISKHPVSTMIDAPSVSYFEATARLRRQAERL